MAKLRLTETCLVCNVVLKDNDEAVVLLPARLTKDRGKKNFYGSQEVPAGLIRIKYLPHRRPSGLLCYPCIKKLGIPEKRNR